MNDVDGEGRVVGDLGFDPDDTLLNALRDEISNPESGYMLLPTDEDRFDALNNILSVRRSKARERIINSTPSLQYLNNDMMVTQ
mgnify:FL=1